METFLISLYGFLVMFVTAFFLRRRKMVSIFQDVSIWNNKAGNRVGFVDNTLERKMAQEELDEMYNALENKDIIELCDGAADVIFVVLGTLHKAGVNEEEFNNVWEEVIKSNNSKFPMIKDESGKVKKGPSFKKPNLNFLLQLD